MSKLFALAAALALAGAAAVAHAHGCPGEMRTIDAKLDTKPQLSAENAEKVKKLRADGEAAHKAGNHGESMRLLAEAKKLLGI